MNELTTGGRGQEVRHAEGDGRSHGAGSGEGNEESSDLHVDGCVCCVFFVGAFLLDVLLLCVVAGTDNKR